MEYKNSRTGEYQKNYFSFDQNGLIYDVIHRYSLEQVDCFLSLHSKEQILKQMIQDNILYLSVDLNGCHISIRHFDYQNGKERSTTPLLPDSCYFFDLETYFIKYFREEERKKIYNKLGGYLNNNHIEAKTKQLIRLIPSASEFELWSQYLTLPYIEQRRIKSIIYESISKELKESLTMKPNKFGNEKNRKLIKEQLEENLAA